jgi:hypothetical protein
VSIWRCWCFYLLGGDSFLVFDSCVFGLLEFGEERHRNVESRYVQSRLDICKVVLKTVRAVPNTEVQSRLNIMIPTNRLGSLMRHGCRLGLCQCAPGSGATEIDGWAMSD